jgi:hypothetical protein
MAPTPSAMPLPAGFRALGDDRVHAQPCDPTRLLDRVRLVDDLRPGVMHPVDEVSGIAECQ